MEFKVVKQIKSIISMKSFMKPNCNICMEEHLMVLKKLHDKKFTLTKKYLNIYGAFRQNKFP